MPMPAWTAPRFFVFLSRAHRFGAAWRHLNVVEVKPGATRLPQSIRSREVRQVLLRTPPMRAHCSTVRDPGMEVFQLFECAERVIEKLDRMTLSMQVADFEGEEGVKKLFDYLWNSEDPEHAKDQQDK